MLESLNNANSYHLSLYPAEDFLFQPFCVDSTSSETDPNLPPTSLPDSFTFFSRSWTIHRIASNTCAWPCVDHRMPSFSRTKGNDTLSVMFNSVFVYSAGPCTCFLYGVTMHMDPRQSLCFRSFSGKGFNPVLVVLLLLFLSSIRGASGAVELPSVYLIRIKESQVCNWYLGSPVVCRGGSYVANLIAP